MKNSQGLEAYSVIDLFAGPGGLGEGFSAYRFGHRNPFQIRLSIEKNAIAHRTLRLRAFYRYFIHQGVPVPKEYYEYIQGVLNSDVLYAKFPEAARCSDEEAICAELGSRDFPDSFFDRRIEKALGRERNWVLLGGPPCQAYSLVGRSRMLGALKDKHGVLIDDGRPFFEDNRHILYQQYLRIIARHSPPVFVMENVKGILSSKLNGECIFPLILRDLQNPFLAAKMYNWDKAGEHCYRTISFVTGKEPDDNKDYLIKAEKYGIPQARHRVIILGIREDIFSRLDGHVSSLPVCGDEANVADVLDDLPKIRSEFSKRDNSDYSDWANHLSPENTQSWYTSLDASIREVLDRADKERKRRTLESRCMHRKGTLPRKYQDWYDDEKLKSLSNHEARKHMSSDLHRYLFVSAYGRAKGSSPRLKDFPESLLPNHRNVHNGDKIQKFEDRFKVQLGHKPASTVTSHISKDGHYFIHPDPVQCRSLTVREAARLQTFPDNYYFAGNRTEQYHQVGNAVPPLLAFQLAAIVHEIFVAIAQ